MLTKSSIVLALAAAASAAPAPGSPRLEARKNDGHGKPAALPESHWKEARLTAEGFTSEKWIKGFEKAQSVLASLTFEQKVRQISSSWPSHARTSS